jgi:hypothetical protein
MMAHSSPVAIRPVYYDDGTLRNDVDWLQRLFPDATFVASTEVLEPLDQHLPASPFPYLCERWRNYPNIRKLIDPGWKLVLDCDMPFFRRPPFFTEWLESPKAPLQTVDVASEYGYPTELIEKLTALRMPVRVNVGLYGLQSETLDWDRSESWIKQLCEQCDTSYFLERAIVTMLVSGAVRCIAGRRLRDLASRSGGYRAAGGNASLRGRVETALLSALWERLPSSYLTATGHDYACLS